MMIEKHISALLYRYQCIIVPGFGAFLTKTQSSHFDEETQVFFPPQKSISFNVYLKDNDGLLANHIALQTDKPYDEIVSIIEEQVKDWKNTLTNSKTLELKGIGYFESNEENNLVFEPISTVNYLSTSFGLSAAKASEIDRITATKGSEFPVGTSGLRKRNNLLKYASVFVAIAGISGFIIKKEYEISLNQETLSLEKEVQNKIQNKIQQATFFIESPIPPITFKVKEVNKPYHIVAGVFKSIENAIRAKDKLKNKGFENAAYLQKNKYGLYPVVYSSFTEIEEAKNAMRTIHKKENRDAWILIQ